MLLARALFDNEADSVDELSFRRSDVLTVHEMDTGGMEGWWLCSLNGKVGIAPANRLKPITNLTSSLTPRTSRSSLGSSTLLDPLPDYDIPSCDVTRPSHDVTFATLHPGLTGGSKSPSTSVLDSDYDTPQSRPGVKEPLETRIVPEIFCESPTPTPGRAKQGTNLFKNFFKRQPQQQGAPDKQEDYDVPTPGKKKTLLGREKNQKHSRKDSGCDVGKKSDVKYETAEIKGLNLKSGEVGRALWGSKTPDVTLKGSTRSALMSTDRDSCLDDYDVPASREESRGVKPKSGWKSMEGLDSVDGGFDGGLGGRLSVRPAPGLHSRSKSQGNLMAATEKPSASSGVNPVELIITINTRQQELRDLFKQISSNCLRWKNLENFISKASAVRLSVTAAWKRLEVFLPFISKLSVGATGGEVLKPHLEKLRKLSDDLENIVGYLTTANTSVLEKAEFDYIDKLSETSGEVEKSLEDLWKTVEENRGVLTSPSAPSVNNQFKSAGNTLQNTNYVVNTLTGSKTQPRFVKCVSSSDLLDSSYNETANPPARQYLQRQRHSMDSVLNNTEDYDVPNSNSEDYDTPSRNTNTNIDNRNTNVKNTNNRNTDNFNVQNNNEDYDIPASKTGLNQSRAPINQNRFQSAQTGFNQNLQTGSQIKPEQTGSNLLRMNVLTGSIDLDKNKRTAFVVGKGNEQFEIFQQRNAQEKPSRVKMVRGPLGGGSPPKSNRDSDEPNSEEFSENLGPTVDYDYPAPSEEARTTAQLPTNDREILQYYTADVIKEVTSLKLVCNELYQSLYNTGQAHDEKTFPNHIKSLFISVHKIQYIGDSILRNLSQGEIRSTIHQRLTDLGKAADSDVIIGLAQTAGVGNETGVKSRQRLAECSKSCLIAALKFAEAVARPKI